MIRRCNETGSTPLSCFGLFVRDIPQLVQLYFDLDLISDSTARSTSLIQDCDCSDSIRQMASVSRIAELASLIQVHTLKVDEYISSHGLPSPSFDASMPAQLRFPESIELSSTTVIEATSELQSLMLGPMGFLVHQIDSPVGIDRSRNPR